MLSTLVDGINVFKVTMKQLQILFNVDISHNSKKSIISKKKKKKKKDGFRIKKTVWAKLFGSHKME